MLEEKGGKERESIENIFQGDKILTYYAINLYFNTY